MDNEFESICEKRLKHLLHLEHGFYRLVGLRNDIDALFENGTICCHQFKGLNSIRRLNYVLHESTCHGETAGFRNHAVLPPGTRGVDLYRSDLKCVA